MKRKLTLAVALLLVGLALSGSDCIFDEKVVRLIVTGESCTDEFDEYHESAEWVTPRTYDVAEKLDEILVENEIDKSQIAEVTLFSATYMVTDPPVGQDWELSGAITIEYVTSSDSLYATIVNYTEQSLLDIDGVPEFVDLNPAGVDIFHQAIQDYLDGEAPVLTFAVENDAVTPVPNDVDPIDFKWLVCLKIYVTVEEAYEWPDVFRG